MKTRTCKRHTCDFCGKGSFFRPVMEKHERRCTANPARVCGMCVMAGLEQKPLAYLEAIITDIDYSVYDEGLAGSQANEKALREETKGCPACLLAVQRQTKKNTGFNLDWKAESKSWLETYGKTVQEDFGYGSPR